MTIFDVSNPLVAIDDGHGMATPGKRTPVFPAGHPYCGTFMHENEFNRAVGKYLEEELKRCGFRTLQVAPTDADDSLGTRVKRANSAKADFYISIHANAFLGKWGKAGGIETLVHFSYAKTKQAGAVIHKHLTGGTKLPDRGLKNGDWLYVCKHTSMPAVLVECGFMDNLYEAGLLKTEAYRRECAREIAQGLCEIFGKKYVPVPKPITAPSRPASAESGDLYRVQIGAFGVKSNAEKLSKDLERKGIKNFIVKDGKLFKVQAGAFSKKANADAYSAQINKLGFKTYIAS